jgi:teichuronic acid exporter
MKWGTQIFTWASTLVVARILTPVDYGIVSLAAVYYGILTLLSEFGVGAGVVAMRDLSEDQLAQMNSLAVLVGLAGFGLSCVFAAPAGHFFHSPQFPLVLIVMSASFVISSFQSVPAALLKKELRFKLISGIDGLRGLSLAVVSVGLALAGLRYWTLVLSAVLSAVLGTVLTLTQRRQRFAWPRFKDLGKQIRFSRDIVIASLGWAVYSNADFVVAGRMLGQTALGAYTVAWNFASAPLEKITSLVGSVTPAYFSAVQQDDAGLRRYLLKPTEAIAFVAFPVMIGMSLVARDAVLLALGHKWEAVILPLQLLALYAAGRSVMPLLPQVLTVRGKTGFLAWSSTSAAVLIPIAFVIGSRWGIQGIAAAWVLAYPIAAVPIYIWTAKEIKLSVRDYYRALRPAIEGCVLMVIVVAMVKRSLPAATPLLVKFCAEVLAGAATYAAVQLVLHRERLGLFKRAIAALR